MPKLLDKPSIAGFARLGCLLFVAALCVASSEVSAFAASAGCNAVNGGGLNGTGLTTKTVTNAFDAGDRIELTLSKPVAGSTTISLSSSLGGDQSKANADNGDTLSLTLAAGNQTITSEISGGIEGSPSITVVCIPGPPASKATTTSIQSSLNPSVVGDAVTFTAHATAVSGVPSGNLTFAIDGADVATVALNGAGTASFTTSSLAAGTHAVKATYGGNSTFTASASPVLNQAVGNDAADSQRLREMQIMATKLVAQTSGQSMQGAIDTAINDGFDENGNPITAGDNSLQVNFAAEPKAMAAKQRAPLDPLAFDQRTAANSPAASASAAIDNSLDPSSQSYGMTGDEALGQRWRPWVNIRDTEWDAGADHADIDGNQVNALAGVTYKISPKLLVGVFAGYEDFNYSSVPLSATLDGNGWTAGAYLGWRVAPALRFDAGIAHSSINYSDTAGAASGEFDGQRWFFTSALTGTHKMGAFIIEPSAKIYALWENEDAYTDSLGTAQAERDFSTGRASGGLKLAYPVKLDGGGSSSPLPAFTATITSRMTMPALR